jgi:hypothetical protein
MEDDNKIARIGFFTLHISYSLHFQHTKHTMFKVLTSTNNYGHNRTTLYVIFIQFYNLKNTKIFGFSILKFHKHYFVLASFLTHKNIPFKKLTLLKIISRQSRIPKYVIFIEFYNLTNTTMIGFSTLKFHKHWISVA